MPACTRPLSPSARRARPIDTARPRAPSVLPLRNGPGPSALNRFPRRVPMPLCRGSRLSAPSSPQPPLTRARTHAEKAGHVTNSLLRPARNCSLSLASFCPLSVSHAQPPSPELAGEVRPPCRPPRAPDATPSLPKRRPEVRNLFPCSGCPDFALS
jgi:hypothetical protein